jgi:response regulator RpfG family c-di-GMP phosphodiesterase
MMETNAANPILPFSSNAQALVDALQERNASTEDHCSRVERLSLLLGESCSLSSYELDCLRIAAKLHDVGVLGIPARILFKPGQLVDNEWSVMKAHAFLGQRICDAMPNSRKFEIGKIVRHHHENFDGTGYPDNLAGEDIPICSRIIGLVDRFDAMQMVRPYREPQSQIEAIHTLRSESGSGVDPYLLRHFETLPYSSREPRKTFLKRIK